MDAATVIKERIDRLEKIKNEYNGKDKGFFQNLIDSQMRELGLLTSIWKERKGMS